MDRPQYVNWIVREDGVVFEDQQPLNCYRLSYVIDDAILDDWALHIRKHYVPDGELEEDAALNKLTVWLCPTRILCMRGGRNPSSRKHAKAS